MKVYENDFNERESKIENYLGALFYIKDIGRSTSVLNPINNHPKFKRNLEWTLFRGVFDT